tara:strand:- start:2290 stop:3585 length:1296 start_codon:yes stop_codon:yes gene_type:complete
MALDFINGLTDFGTNQKFLLRDFRNAARLAPGVNPPRQKFEGYVNFILNRELYSALYGDVAQNEFRTQISSLIRTADLPSVVFQTETKNSYNKKKIVNTGVTYNPVTMTVFDTIGNEWITTLMKYFSYHFMDPRNNQKADDRDIAAGNIREGGVENINSSYGTTSESLFNSNDAGYNLNSSAQFFERIDYVLYHGNKGVQYSIINPMMSEFKPGSIDYSSSELQEFTLTFDYERFTVFNKLNFELGAEDVDRFEQLGAISGDLFSEDITKPVVLETQRTLDILGTEEKVRDRTLQPAVPKPPAESGGSSDDEKAQEDKEKDGEGNETDDTTTEEKEGVPGTYSQSYDAGQLAGASASAFGDTTSDVLGSIADSALSAVLRGQNVKDAIVSTAVQGITTAFARSVNAENTNQNTEVAEDDKIDPSSTNQTPE